MLQAAFAAPANFAGVPSQTPTRFVAVIGHADDPDMLRRCIEHHLTIGVEKIFVSLNNEDAEAESVVREFEGGGAVRAMRIRAFSPDPYAFFTNAKDLVIEWVAPEWILFVDSDEFWVPASGRIEDTAHLESTDVFTVPRYNVPPIRSAGALTGFELTDLASTLVGAREKFAARYYEEHPEVPWITAQAGPKTMARPHLVTVVGTGAHAVGTALPSPRRTQPQDLLVLHLPITTEARFLAKVKAIRARVAAAGARWGPDVAWHWRRWIAIDDAGGIHAEFERQIIAADDIGTLLGEGALARTASIFARRFAAPE